MLGKTAVCLVAGLLAGLAGCRCPGPADESACCPVSPVVQSEPAPAPAGVHQFSARSIEGDIVDLSTYRGKVLLIVNVASRCGNTPQYAGLQALYEEKKDAGLVICGFPANDFGLQEPGSDEQIQAFCTQRFGVTFPMFSKIHVKGPDKHPLYAWLTDKQIHPEHGGEIDWNFAKFLVGRDGQVIARFKAGLKPTDPRFIEAVDAALAAE